MEQHSQKATSRLRSFSQRGQQLNTDNKNVLSKSPLEIIPSEVVFKEIEVNQYYEITVEIRNLSPHSTRIRVLSPKAPNFQVICPVGGELAPGLAITAKVKYECKELKNETEIIKIINQEGYSIELPIRVYKTESQILFEPFVNLGFLGIGKEVVENIAVKNCGKAYGVVEFSHQCSGLTVEPKVLKIAPMQEDKIVVKYKPTEAGIFKDIINLKSDSILVKDTIGIHATALEFARFIVDDKGNQNTSFDFGTLFTGQETVIKAFIVNNSPKPMKFRAGFRKGYLTAVEEFALVQTPAEIGTEQSERTMFLEPEMGEVEPFAEFEIKLVCRSRVTYRERIYAKNYALLGEGEEAAIANMKNSPEFSPENVHEYSALIKVEDSEPLIIQLKSTTVCPTIKLSQNTFQFGDCTSKEKRELSFWVENKSASVKTEISFPKIPNFSVKPDAYILKPLEKCEFKVVFEPKTIGKMDTTQLLLISRLYELELRCFGISTSTNRSLLKEKITSNKEFNNKIVSSKELEPITSLNPSRPKAMSLTQKNINEGLRKEKSILNKIDMELLSLTNKQKYSKFLGECRTERLQSEKEQKVQKKWSLYQQKLKEIAPNQIQAEVDEEGLPIDPPIDHEFETGLLETGLPPMKVNLPEGKDKLFVVRHVMDYEPNNIVVAPEKKLGEKFNKGFDDVPKKIHPSTPLNYNIKREITGELNPEELSQIQVSSNILDFSETYIKSTCKGYFWLKNNTKKHIQVQLIFKDNELSKSFKEKQIVPPNGEAGFEVTFWKDTLGDFRGIVKYVINSVHEFEMVVTAKCVPVVIEADKTQLKLFFKENDYSFAAKEILNLTNPGNSDAVFKITLGKDRLFMPEIVEGKIPPKKTIKIPISFTAPEQKSSKNEYNFNERLVIKVLDGPEVPIHCHLTHHPTAFSVKAPQSQTLCHLHKYVDFVEIKNLGKNPIILHISSKDLRIDEYVRVTHDEPKKLKIEYLCEEIGDFQFELKIKPKCGIAKTVTFNIKVLEPKITFSTQEIDLGVLVVQGVAGSGQFSLTNETDIELPIYVDLRKENYPYEFGQEQIENVQIALLSEEQRLEPVVEVEEEKERKITVEDGENLAEREVNEDDFSNSFSSDDEELVHHEEQKPRLFHLTAKPHETLTFTVTLFCSTPGPQSLHLPFSIPPSHLLPSAPILHFQGIKPKLVVEPLGVEFGRKIVMKPERSYPKILPLKIENLDEEEIEWYINDAEIRKESIFTLEKTKGKLQHKEFEEIKVGFNPYVPGKYEYVLPLYITNNKTNSCLKYTDITLKGSSALPALFFNKREVILPVVPLDVETTSSFKIINDGYENCNLKYQFVDDVAQLGVKVIMNEGNNIGITRQKLKVDLVWKSNKPISFCLILEFIDDMNRSFSIPVSGTADNCILTNYTYFLRNEQKFKITQSQSGSLILTENQGAQLVRKNSAHSLRSNSTNKSLMSYLGVPPISQSILHSTIDYIKRYLNCNLLTTPIKEFPNSLIESDGAQLFEILSFVSSKTPSSFPYKYTSSPSDPPPTKTLKLFTQYNELLKLLKIEGAHLNHIRPEYLMSFQCLNVYLSVTKEEKTKTWLPSLTKISQSLYNYLSMEAWITVLYQIIKIYILARVTVKNIKSHIPEIKEIPKEYLERSNFISLHESILLYWVEDAINEVLLEERRLTNFDKDFKDGIAIACLLQKYAKIPIIKKMKLACTIEEDLKENINLLLPSLHSLNLQNSLQAKDIYSPLQREMLCFLLQLYLYLPFYLPKQSPIVFKCVLGEEVTRSIELSNPSNKVVVYKLNYTGSQDFKLPNDSLLTLEPKETKKLEITFVSRLSSPSKGTLLLINQKNNSLTAAPVVFELLSEIVGRTSDRIWNVTGVMYEQVEFSVEVENKFQTSEIVDFQIAIQTEYILPQEKSRGTKNNEKMEKLAEELKNLKVIFCKQENVKIRKNGTVSLTLSYIPLSLFTTKTTLIFSNSYVGEFQHEIIADVEPPTPLMPELRPPTSLTVDQSVHWSPSLPPKNEPLSKALKVIENMKRHRKNTANTEKLDSSQYPQNFHIQITENPYVTSTKESVKIIEKSKETQENENKLDLVINCKAPIYEYPVYIMLYNESKTDVRRFKAVLTILPKPLKAILEMRVPARKEIVQNLPIVNNTDRDWNVKVVWSPNLEKNGQYFSVPSQFLTNLPVKKQSTANFPLTFKPKWADEAEATLTLSNPLTMDIFHYEIFGHGEEPLAEEHIEIHCNAKDKVAREIIVKNPYIEKSVVFDVESDVINFEGEKQITVPPGGKEKYSFSVQPMLCGEYTGSITFQEQQGPQYLWYTVKIITNYPEAFATLEISSEIRQKKLTEIVLPCEHNVEGEYSVVMQGAGISGEEKITITPGKENKYILEYLPLEVGNSKGSICFVNEELGEILVEVNLKCIDKSVVTIPTLKSPLGISKTIELVFENPSTKKSIVKCTNSNPQAFTVSESFTLSPLENRIIPLIYIPSTLEEIQHCELLFHTNTIGCWRYRLTGIGTTPVPAPLKTVINGIDEEHSDSIIFRNPFNKEIGIGVKLIFEENTNGKEEGNEEVFELLDQGRKRRRVEAGGIVEVGFKFMPKKCGRFYCNIIVMISEKIFWTFPIEGITEIKHEKPLANLVTQCRQACSEFLQLELEGLVFTPENNSYTFTLENIPEHLSPLIKKSLLIELPKPHLSHSKDLLSLELLFKPLKPFKCALDLLICKKEGAQWRYRINIEGKEPSPDDTIEIYSNIMETTTVTFKLTNVEKVSAYYNAKFTSDSAPEFSMDTKSGVLAPYGSKGTNFYVSFTPVEYGKEKKGKLIIETEEMYWSYLLKGNLPKYIPPQPNQSRLKSKSINSRIEKN